MIMLVLNAEMFGVQYLLEYWLFSVQAFMDFEHMFITISPCIK